jgi:thiamine pyrophosphate-dependent acetolactate synthase large subunit-like protein
MQQLLRAGLDARADAARARGRDPAVQRCVSVVVIPGDVALRPAAAASAPKPLGLVPRRPVVTPADESLGRLAELLNGAQRVPLLCGSDGTDAHAEVLLLAETELEQKSTGFLATGTDLVNPNKRVRIEDPAEVEARLGEALAHPGPVLVDAVVNRIELAMTERVTTEMAKGFTFYMLKAVPSGRGDEIVELVRTNLRR